MTTNNVNAIEIAEPIATINTNVEGTIKFNAKWDMFIIPNHAISLLDEHVSLSYAKKQIQPLAEIGNANNCIISVIDRLVQVWYCNEQCENGVRHDPYVVDLSGRVWDISFNLGEYLPEPIVRELHEGETSIINIPVTLESYDVMATSNGCRSAIMKAHITPKQKAYRYRGFGTFEEVLERVLL